MVENPPKNDSSPHWDTLGTIMIFEIIISKWINEIKTKYKIKLKRYYTEDDVCQLSSKFKSKLQFIIQF